MSSTVFIEPESSSNSAAVFSATAAANCHAKTTQNADIGGWTFLQSLTKTKDSAAVYVHPTEKRSASMLSEKSLEMCTESLGSETGSDLSDEMSILSMESGSSYPIKPRKNNIPKRINRNNSFPPPLTSISSSSGVQMVSYREGDRLVLQAVPLPSQNTFFHTERADGRLKLSLLKECDIEGETETTEEAETEAEAETEEEEEEEGNCGNSGVEEISRLSRGRCKEGGQGQRSSLLNWEPFWVAT